MRSALLACAGDSVQPERRRPGSAKGVVGREAASAECAFPQVVKSVPLRPHLPGAASHSRILQNRHLHFLGHRDVQGGFAVQTRTRRGRSALQRLDCIHDRPSAQAAAVYRHLEKKGELCVSGTEVFGGPASTKESCSRGVTSGVASGKFQSAESTSRGALTARGGAHPKTGDCVGLRTHG